MPCWSDEPRMGEWLMEDCVELFYLVRGAECGLMVIRRLSSHRRRWVVI